MAPLTDEQVQHLTLIEEEWSKYDPLVAAIGMYAGGMTFKKVKGYEYLVRYYADPTTGKKKFTSLGARTSENETLLKNWLEERDAHREAFTTSNERIRLLGRVAKAMRLARFPSDVALVVQILSLSDLFDHALALAGVHALYGYETLGGVMARATSLRTELPVQGVTPLPLDEFKRLLEPLSDNEIACRHVGDRLHFEFDTARFEVRRISDLDFQTDTRKAIVVSRSSRPLQITVLTPAAWLKVHGEREYAEARKFVECVSSAIRPFVPGSAKPRSETTPNPE